MAKTIRDWQRVIHRNAIDKGWYSGPKRSPGEMLMLITSEVVEAFEEIRDGRGVTEVYYKGEKPEGVMVELADAVIRILDFAEAEGVDLDQIMEEKHKYNVEKRGFRHGGKTL